MTKDKLISDLVLVRNDLDMWVDNIINEDFDNYPWDINDIDNWKTLSNIVNEAIAYIKTKE